MTSEAGRRPPVPPFARRGAVAVVGAVGVVFALALALQLRRWTTVERVPTGDAAWIWTEVPRQKSTPVAFWAVADFELAAVPAAAELLALGDEEYVLFLNGRRVGSNVYAPGAPLDVYEVAPLLRPGGNRLAVELRSSRGDGGFLAALAEAGPGPAGGRALAATGAGWRLLAEQTEGVVGGELPAGVPARVLGRPPTGKWGAVARGPARPLFTVAATPAPADGAVAPRRLAPLGRNRPAPSWRPYLQPDRLPRWLATERPPGVVFDFGREVEGYLNLRFARGVPQPVGLLFAGDEPVDPLSTSSMRGALARAGPAAAEAADGTRRLEGLAAGAPILTVPGRRNWSDAVPRRFRYAAVVGLPGLFGAWVDEVGEEAAAGLPKPPEPVVGGVFGLTPPPLRSPIEDEVWRDLQGVADLAGRQGP